MLKRLLTFCRLVLFLLAFAALPVAALCLAPDLGTYRLAYVILLLLLFLLAYYAPQHTWPALILLLPWAALPSRAALLGAHQPVIFLGLSFALGYWANRLVTGQPSPLSPRLKVPLLLMALLGLSSAFWTALRFGCALDALPTPFFYDRIINADGVTASEALRVTTLHAFLFVLLPALVWIVAALFAGCQGREERRALLRRLFTWLALGLWPVLLTACYQHFRDPAYAILGNPAWAEARRASGGMSDPNALGLFCALFAPVAALLAARGGRLPQRIFLGLTALFALGVMTFSGSRSSLLLTGLCLLLWGGWGAWSLLAGRGGLQFLKKPVVPIAAVLALLAALLFLAPASEALSRSHNPAIARLARQLKRGSRPGADYLDNRGAQWRQALRIWREYPLTGVGLGSFSLEVSNYNREAGDETPTDNPWNQYLTWGVELGLIGFLVWLLFLGLAARDALLRRETPYLSLLLLAFAAASFFGAHLHAPEITALVGVLLGVHLAANAGPQENFAISRRWRLAAAALFLLFNGVYLFLSVGPLAGEGRRERFGLSRDFGCYRAENWQGAFEYRWLAPRAGFYLKVPRTGRVLKLRLAGLDPALTPRNPQVVTFYYAGVMLDTIVLEDPEWREIKLDIFPWLPEEGLLCLASGRPYKPAGEMRTLGVALAKDYEFTADFNRQAQGLLRYESLREGRTAVAQEGLAWQPYCESEKVYLQFPMQHRLPFEPREIGYELYLGEKLIKEFTLPLDGALHELECPLPQGDKPPLSIRALRTVSRRLTDTKRPKPQGIRVLAISDF